MSFKGLNYGQLSLSNEAILSLVHKDRPILTLNYDHINNSTVNKQDIIIETTSEDLGNEDLMCEIRFHVEEPRQDKEEE
jgi:hypothetical protein